MKIDVNSLLAILGKQKELIDELLDLAGEQLQSIKQNDLAKIKFITGQQEYIGRQLAVLEKRWGIVLEQYSREMGIEIKNFSELGAYSSSDDFAQIKEPRDTIIASSQRLQEEQELNTWLLKQGLKFTEQLAGIIDGKSSCIYSRSGDVLKTGNKLHIDTNA